MNKEHIPMSKDRPKVSPSIFRGTFYNVINFITLCMTKWLVLIPLGFIWILLFDSRPIFVGGLHISTGFICGYAISILVFLLNSATAHNLFFCDIKGTGNTFFWSLIVNLIPVAAVSFLYFYQWRPVIAGLILALTGVGLSAAVGGYFIWHHAVRVPPKKLIRWASAILLAVYLTPGVAALMNRGFENPERDAFVARIYSEWRAEIREGGDLKP